MERNRLLLPLLIVALAFCCCCAAAVGIGAVVAGLTSADLALGGSWMTVTEQFERTMEVRGPVTLFVDVPIGNVTVQAGAVDRVSVTATKRAWGVNRSAAEERLRQIAISVVGTGERVEVRVSGVATSRNFGRAPQVDLVIVTPSVTALVLDSRVGKVTVAGLQGDVTVTADVGEVFLRDIVPSEKLQVATRVASIEMSGPLAGRVVYELTSDVGRIAVQVPAGSAFNIDARSDIGDVRLDFPLSGSSSREGLVGKEVRGQVGESPTVSLWLRSRVGEITVRPLP